MTSNTQFTHPFDKLLREHVYGEIEVERFVTTYCEGTCRDWRPINRRAYNSRPGESPDERMARLFALDRLESDMEMCQGHQEPVDTVKGMLRSYTFKAPAENHSTYGTLSLTVLPWDEQKHHLTCSRVIRSRVFDYRLFDEGCGFAVFTDYGSNAVYVELKKWRWRSLG